MTPAPKPSEVSLTPRQLDFCRLFIEGRADKEIADAMAISHAGVRKHFQDVFDRLVCALPRSRGRLTALLVRDADMLGINSINIDT